MQQQEITSSSNEKIKNLKKLAKKSWRDQTGQFLVENLKIIHDALKAGFHPVAVYLTAEMLKSNNDHLRYILYQLDHVFVIDEQINKSFSSLTTPSGICAVYDKQEQDIDLKQRVVYLNHISDPGNVGTILRTALAFNFKNIVVDADCADIYNPKTINSAKEAIFKLKLSHDSDYKIFDKIKKKMPIYGTRAKEAEPLENIANDKAFCLIFGNEANGISQELLPKADGFIKIGISDNIESLNVAITAGIILHQLRGKDN